jgi:hypothetical protein
MCNACGMVCCAWDGFGRCECDCKEPGCWEACDTCRCPIPPGEYCFNGCRSDDDPIEESLDIEPVEPVAEPATRATGRPGP